MSDRPIPPPQKKRNKTKQNNNKNTTTTKKHTHTHKHLLWYGAERAAVSRSCHGAPRPENGDTNSQSQEKWWQYKQRQDRVDGVAIVMEIFLTNFQYWEQLLVEILETEAPPRKIASNLYEEVLKDDLNDSNIFCTVYKSTNIKLCNLMLGLTQICHFVSQGLWNHGVLTFYLSGNLDKQGKKIRFSLKHVLEQTEIESYL